MPRSSACLPTAPMCMLYVLYLGYSDTTSILACAARTHSALPCLPCKWRYVTCGFWLLGLQPCNPGRALHKPPDLNSRRAFLHAGSTLCAAAWPAPQNSDVPRRGSHPWGRLGGGRAGAAAAAGWSLGGRGSTGAECRGRCRPLLQSLQAVLLEPLQTAACDFWLLCPPASCS